MQIRGVDPDGDRLSYALVTPTSNQARTHFYVGNHQNGEGQVYVGLSLTQTQTDRFTLSIRATDNSAQPQTSNTLTVCIRNINVMKVKQIFQLVANLVQECRDTLAWCDVVSVTSIRSCIHMGREWTTTSAFLQ